MDDQDPRRRWSVIGATGMTVAYAWWAAGLRPFTRPALVAVLAAGVAAILVGSRRRRRMGPPGHDRGGVQPWGILGAVLAGWELAAYLQHPRADHPTLSALAGQVLDWHPARVVALLAWLAVGADLARR